MRFRTALLLLALTLLCPAARPQQAPPQQVIQAGALNAPAALLTPDGQWSSLIPILSSADLDLFIEDPSSETWLSRNAAGFLDRGQYTISLVSFYKSMRPCRADQTRAGFSDAAHITACADYRYHIRQIAIDSPQNTISLLFSAMVSTGGTLDSSSITRETRTRAFSSLDPDIQKALSDATRLVAQQSRSWAARQNAH